MEKRISVIIPVYNAEKYIGKCVDSLMDGGLGDDDEILLINDGSTDRSAAVIEELAAKYPIVTAVSRENGGAAAARNSGIEMSRGKYISFIDNDDKVEKGYFDDFYRKAEETGADAVIGGYKRTGEKGVLYTVKSVPSDWFPLIALAPWGKIFRGDFIRESGIRFLEYSLGEDIYFNLKVYTAAKKTVFTENCGYCWYMNGGSVSNTSQKSIVRGRTEHLLDEIYSFAGNENSLICCFYVRTVIFYLLFGGRASPRELFTEEYKSNFHWLEEHSIPVKIPVFSNKLAGEPFKNRIIIFIFLIIHRLGLIKLFAGFYCRG